MKNQKPRAATTSTEALKILWEEGFFLDWKKISPIEESLAKRGNHFSINDLAVALARAKHLTRRGKRRNYEYIQKYPFDIHPQESKPKKKK